MNDVRGTRRLDLSDFGIYLLLACLELGVLFFVLLKYLSVLTDDWLILHFELVDCLVHCLESLCLLEAALEVY